MVSVIVPSYNHSRFLKQRIDSILTQEYVDFELIILDDCSPDNSRDIIEEYRNQPKVSHIIFNETNSGSVFKQWKKGIELAKGEYIWIAESDDFADNTFLSKLVPVLNNDKEIGLVYCNSKIIYESNKHTKSFNTLNELRKYMFKTSLWDVSFTMDGFDFFERYLSKKCVINNASSVVFRRNAISDLSVNLDDYKFAGDWAVYCSIAKKHKISFLNEDLSFYRDHSTNVSKRGAANFLINFENYKILSDNYSTLVKNKKNTAKYLYSVRRSFLHLLIVSKDRKYIYKTYLSIDGDLIKKSVIFLPLVFIETYTSMIYHTFLSKLK